MAEETKKLQALDVAGLNLLVGKLKDGTLVVAKAASVDAENINGMIPLDKIPQGALERLVIVKDDSARLALNSDQVQEGDTIKVQDTGKMYYVKNEAALGTEEAFEEYVVGTAARAAIADAVAWSGITGKPEEFKPAAHNQPSSTINALTGYKKDTSESPEAIAESDNLNTALGKLEKKADDNTAKVKEIGNNVEGLKGEVEELQSSVEGFEPIPTSTIEAIIAGTYSPEV